MDFDHLPGRVKEFTISAFVRQHGGEIVARALLEAEIAKCQVVCSNCHRDRTWQRSKGRIFGTLRYTPSLRLDDGEEEEVLVGAEEPEEKPVTEANGRGLVGDVDIITGLTSDGAVPGEPPGAECHRLFRQALRKENHTELFLIGTTNDGSLAFVLNCARCGGQNHEQLAVKEMQHPIEWPRGVPASTIFNRWTTCPTSGDPILIILPRPLPVPAELPNDRASE